MSFTQKIKALQNSIAGFIGGTSTRGIDPTTTYPNKFKPYTNNPDYTDDTWKSSRGYSFRVVDYQTNEDAADFREFPLQINPQELQQDEVFAIQVTPTLRGVLVEHQGVLIKDINLSGTTGVSPKRGEAGTTNEGESAYGHTGYKEFHELRSYFRAYAEAKRVDENGTLRMLFINRKDGEAIYVEPQKFSMKRSAQKPSMYDYNIVLKGIGNASIPKEAEAAETLFSKINGWTNNIRYATETINASVELITRTERDLQRLVLTPLAALGDAITAVKNGRDQILSVTNALVSQLNSECERIKANFADVIGKSNESYDRATGRTQTLVESTSRTATYQEYKILNAFNNIQKTCISVLSEPSLFAQDPDKRSNDVEDIYKSRSVGSDGNAEIINDGKLRLLRPRFVDSVTILGNDTIQTIASRHLGNPDRFRELVILNNLKPPYLADVASNGVLAYGGTILIPAKQGGGKDLSVRMNKDYEITKNLEYAKKSLGVDLRLDDEFDIVFANFGDYDLTAGIENMAQAILLKVFYENGSLKRHRSIGSSLRIGSKVKDLNTVRRNMMSSLNQDKRVESVPFLALKQEGNTTTITASIRIVGVSQPVPVTVEV